MRVYSCANASLRRAGAPGARQQAAGHGRVAALPAHAQASGGYPADGGRRH